MTTIPAICAQYTAVFQTARLEIGIALLVGVVAGMLAQKFK